MRKYCKKTLPAVQYTCRLLFYRLFVLDKKVDIAAYNNTSTIKLALSAQNNRNIAISVSIYLLDASLLTAKNSPSRKMEKINIANSSGKWVLVSGNSRRITLAPVNASHPLIDTPIIENLPLTLRQVSEGFEH